MRAERGQEKAEARERRAAQSGDLPSVGPFPREEREEEGHGEVHDAVGGGADNTGHLGTAVQGPVGGIVLLEDAVCHGEAWGCK